MFRSTSSSFHTFWAASLHFENSLCIILYIINLQRKKSSQEQELMPDEWKWPRLDAKKPLSSKEHQFTFNKQRVMHIDLSRPLLGRFFPYYHYPCMTSDFQKNTAKPRLIYVVINRFNQCILIWHSSRLTSYFAKTLLTRTRALWFKMSLSSNFVKSYF